MARIVEQDRRTEKLIRGPTTSQEQLKAIQDRNAPPPAKRVHNKSFTIGEIVAELARTKQLKPGIPYEKTDPPIRLFPDQFKEEHTRMASYYRRSMRLASEVVTSEQDRLFRADETIEDELLEKAGLCLDEACVEWLVEKGKRKTKGKLTALMLGVAGQVRTLEQQLGKDVLWSRATPSRSPTMKQTKLSFL